MRAGFFRIMLLSAIVELAFAHTAGAQYYYFRHYQVEHGLSNNTVGACLQDNKGFMWFGTRDGLNRFDGYSFKAFNHDPQNRYSLGSNFIKSLHEDNHNNLWVGTDKGLYRYDAVLERFYSFPACKGGEVRAITTDRHSNLWYICNQRLYRATQPDTAVTAYDHFRATSITVTPQGDVWISDLVNVIRRYIPSTNSFETYDITNGSGVNLVIEKILPIDDHTFIIGSSNQGLLLYDLRAEKLSSLNNLTGATPTVFVRDILRAGNNEFWIATESGIYIYQHALQKITHLKKEYNDPYSLSDNAVYALFKDRENGIWACTYFGGVNYRSETSSRFRKFYTRPGTNALQGNAIREICRDGEGNLWIGTEDAGLHVLEADSEKFTHYLPSGDPASLGYHNIHALLVRGDQLWIGTFKHGLEVMDLRTRRIVKRYLYNNSPDSADRDFVYSLLHTSAGKIMAGTGAGLYEMDASKAKGFSLVPWVPPYNLITCQYEDTQGTLWAGTIRDGLFGHTPGTMSAIHITHVANDSATLPSNRVNGIFEDSRKNFWLCTDNGLALYDRLSRKVIRVYNEASGLPSDLTFRALEDDSGKLWVSTSKGLATIDPRTGRIQIYTKAHGLLSNQFNYNSAFRNEDGTMYFGSVNGLISFNPDQFAQDDYIPPVYITGMQIDHIEVPIRRSGSPLQKAISDTQGVTLAYDQSTFSLDFAALSYKAPEMTRYAYKMEGIDKDWVHLTNNRKVYFTDLSPGTYTFKVKALTDVSPTDGHHTATLRIQITPPVWASRGAYIFYTLLAASVIVLLIMSYKKTIERKNKIRLDFFRNEKEKELYNAKIEFFTNIAHEIKTPLTLISLPLQKILNQHDIDNEVKANLKIMEKNTNRLINLSNQLLDFRKTEKNVFSLSFVKTDICELLTDLLQQFRPAAEEKKILITTTLPNIHFQGYVDPEALKKILSNLFSNAIKYGQKNLWVSILPFSSNDVNFSIQVSNDGPLIPESFKEKIFDPFFRLTGNEAEGTGIGLALAQSLTRLHKGTLAISTENNVNTFVLSLPIHQEKEFQLFDETFEQIAPSFQEKPVAEKSGLHTILLVEDNQEIRDFIAKELSHEYNIITAGNGAEAFERLDDTIVQLIISDVMMPVMDGFEFCRRIKSSVDYCHIPVILLTAKNTLKSKIEGLEMGADAYIEKPFSQQHLNAQIISLLKNRDKIKEFFSASPLANIRTMAHSKADESFLLKITDIITRNMGESEVNVELMAEAVNMSRQTLYRKVRGLTNLSPHELIMVTKLKKAAELLITGDYKIYEVAEKVGYSVAANFSRDFTKQFGISPSEYLHSKK